MKRASPLFGARAKLVTVPAWEATKMRLPSPLNAMPLAPSSASTGSLRQPLAPSPAQHSR